MNDQTSGGGGSIPDLPGLLAQAIGLHQADQLAGAQVLYERILNRLESPSGPASVAALLGLADIDTRARNFRRAEERLRRAVSLEPSDAGCWRILADTLLAAGRPAEARDAYDRALALGPGADTARGWLGRGLSELQLGRLDEGRECFARATAVQPDFAEAWCNQAYVSLLQGDLLRGWELYEWRFRTKLHEKEKRPVLGQPWSGREPIAGRRLLVHAEQGLGDTLQFCRYVPLLAAAGAHVILRAPAPLLSLLRRLEGAAEVIPDGSPVTACDYHCPLLSLPRCFATDLATIPAGRAYLAPDPALVTKWARRLGPQHLPRIGLVWSGNPRHIRDAQRSVPLADFAPLMGQRLEFVSLQAEVRETDQAALASFDQLRHFGGELGDFADTAALCLNLDAVISVDTSVAHLSGAVGVPTHLLLPRLPDWRWLLDRTDSPWYPAFTLHRQACTGGWAPVIARVSEAVAHAGSRVAPPSAPR